MIDINVSKLNKSYGFDKILNQIPDSNETDLLINILYRSIKDILAIEDTKLVEYLGDYNYYKNRLK